MNISEMQIRNDGCLIISEGTMGIKERAFMGGMIESVQFPKSLKVIGYRSFANCEKLKMIDIPKGVEYIGNEAFLGCTSLEIVSIPKSVKRMENAFSDCNNLKKLYLPQHLVGKVVAEMPSNVQLVVK